MTIKARIAHGKSPLASSPAGFFFCTILAERRCGMDSYDNDMILLLDDDLFPLEEDEDDVC